MPSPALSQMTYSSNNDPSAPKQSWFAGLFNWKQLVSHRARCRSFLRRITHISATCLQNYTLMSTDNAHPTRLACKKLLENIGVQVVVQNADGMAVLKCRASELRGTSRLHSLACSTSRSRR